MSFPRSRFTATLCFAVLALAAEAHSKAPELRQRAGQGALGGLEDEAKALHTDSFGASSTRLLLARRARDPDGTQPVQPDQERVPVAHDHAQAGVASAIFGVFFIMAATVIQWFNEERSVRIETLLERGRQECISIEPAPVFSENRGCLVHVQGRARGVLPVTDVQFKDVLVKRCLKFQSTVEVFEWVQTTRAWVDGKEMRSQPRFHPEWTTVHCDSQRFRKPSPENPRLPSGMMLGTWTMVCPRVELGSFVLPERMVNQLHRFEPAMKLLPAAVTAHGITFMANPQDGYYYARPGSPTELSRPGMFMEHKVGDLRARFLVVPETDCTVVGVQCHKDEHETFLPYRAIPRAPCLSEWQERQKLIEEGDRSLKDLRREVACCTGGVASCCCCPCNAMAICCTQEVVTEEIFHVSDQLEPLDRPFRWVVTRNPLRVWCFRIIGLSLTWLGMSMILGALRLSAQRIPSLATYGRSANMVFCSIFALTTMALITAAAYAFYRPAQSLKWLCAAGAITAAGPLCARLG